MVKEVTCPGCGYRTPVLGTHCIVCGKLLPPSVTKNAGLPGGGGLASTTTSSGMRVPNVWAFILIIIEIIGLVFSILGVWIIGIPLLVAGGYYAYTKEEDWIPRITIIGVAISIRYINLIPQNTLLSLFGVVVGFMAIILLLPEGGIETKTSHPRLLQSEVGEELNPKQKGASIAVFIVALGFTIFWTYFCIPTQLLAFLFTVPLIILSIVWKQPLLPTWKFVASLVCLAPFIGYGLNFILVAGGAAFGGLVDQVQYSLGRGLGGVSTGTALDMILNPKLAVQAQLKPVTQKEAEVVSGPPSTAFTVTGGAIISTGCYDTDSFRLKANVKNTGSDYLRSVNLSIAKYIPSSEQMSLGPDNPCTGIEIHGIDPGSLCNWSLTNLPAGASSPDETCLIDSVARPTVLDPNTQVAATHSCFFDVTGTTGYHSIGRLEIQFMNGEYASSKFDTGKLTQAEVPSITSIGPIDFGISGLEQPVLYYTDMNRVSKVSLITGISNSGAGSPNYLSAYMYIPTVLLDGKGQCNNSQDSWTCISKALNSTTCASLPSESIEQQYCDRLLTFKTSQTIGGYNQYAYDGSDDLLTDGAYNLCFSKGIKDSTGKYQNLKPDSVNIGTCTLNIGNVMGSDTTALRKSLIIRGDVLYTYSMAGSTSISVRECNVQ